jgi:uncharacterized integral membrane protein (TIGR00698 family)
LDNLEAMADAPACLPLRNAMSDSPAPAPAIAARPTITFGVGLCALLAAAAFLVRALPGFSALSPMILSIVLGMAFHNLIGTPAAAKLGTAFAMRRILRFGVVLLGFQLTVQQIRDVGLTGVIIIAFALLACFGFTIAAGRALKVERKLTQLIAAGTSICGASAVIATNSVTQAPEEDMAYAVVCVTLFGTIAMFVYPLLPALLHLSPRNYGLWTGASVHEVAQVVAAAYQDGKEAGDYGTITKLTRVIFLAPMVLVLGSFAWKRAEAHARPCVPVPYFILGFLAAVFANSMFPLPPMPKTAIVTATTFLLALALAALGLETDFGKLRAKGVRPLLLCGLASVFLAGLSLMLVKAVG